MRVLKSASPEETRGLAQKFAKEFLQADALLLFYGEMGSGKTTFIKGLAAGLDIPEEQVTSPTFVYLNIYEGTRTVYHFDLWRLKSKEEFLSLGFDEFLGAPGIKCIEWSEKLENLLNEGDILGKVIKITFSAPSEGCREIILESQGETGAIY